AYQRGWLPVAQESLVQAIALNGTAGEFNPKAFDWGRRAAADWPRLRSLIDSNSSKAAAQPPAQDLDEVIQRRTATRTEDPNAKLAETYRARVQQFRDAETRIAGEPGKLPETVARNYFKVLATKDEYEVARLFTNGDF